MAGKRKLRHTAANVAQLPDNLERAEVVRQVLAAMDEVAKQPTRTSRDLLVPEVSERSPLTFRDLCSLKVAGELAEMAAVFRLSEIRSIDADTGN